MTPKAVPADTYWDTVWMKDPFCVDDWNRRHPVETDDPPGQEQRAVERIAVEEPGDGRPAREGLRVAGRAELDAVTTEACLWQSDGGGDGGSGELIPAYLNRLWVCRTDTVVVPWTFSMLDFRECGFTA